MIRVVKERRAWEPGDPFSDFYEMEVCREDRRADLRLSVYRVEDDAESARVACEHKVAYASPKPTKPLVWLQLAGGYETYATARLDPTSACFRRLRELHHELVFASAAVHRIFAQWVFDTLDARQRAAGLVETIGCILVEGDAEWRAFEDSVAGSRTWLKIFARARAVGGAPV